VNGAVSVRSHGGGRAVSATDAIQSVIEQAVEAAVRRALNIHEVTNRRMLSVQEAAVYLSLSKREVYNMIANKELPVLPYKTRKKTIDIRDLDQWIEANKV
jgi:excisionase family DNA binding protein